MKRHFLLAKAGNLLLLVLFSLASSILSAQDYKVTFLANHPFNEGETPSRAGHVWVILSDDNTKQVWGFYSDGLSDKKDVNNRADADYTFSTDKLGYERALQVVQDFKTRGYLLGSKDCRSFAASIAQAIGLKTPSLGLKSPGEWLGELVTLNF